MRWSRLLLLLMLVASPLAAQLPRTIVLVRHAERAEDGTNDPGLSPAGEARAQALADALRDARVSAIITSQYRRTQLTGLPLSNLTGAAPLIIAASRDVPAHARAVAEAVRNRSAAGTIVVIGHSNTIPPIIAALGGPSMPNLCETEFSNLFTLTIQPTGEVALVRGKFGADDATPPTADCRR